MTDLTADGRKEPTEKMLDFARSIEIMTGVPFDATVEHDFWSCHAYISANEGKYRLLRAEARAERAAERRARQQQRNQERRRYRSTEFIGGDYGIGNNDMGISSSDFGIFPWGDS